MRAWGYAPRVMSCGSCGHPIVGGAPVSYWQEAGKAWSRLRCVECAGDVAPPPLPDAIVTKAPEENTMTRISDTAPTRTRGALREVAREWLPYSDEE